MNLDIFYFIQNTTFFSIFWPFDFLIIFTPYVLSIQKYTLYFSHEFIYNYLCEPPLLYYFVIINWYSAVVCIHKNALASYVLIGFQKIKTINIQNESESIFNFSCTVRCIAVLCTTSLYSQLLCFDIMSLHVLTFKQEKMNYRRL